MAPSDLAEPARKILGDEARLRQVSLKVMRTWDEWFADGAIWGVVEP